MYLTDELKKAYSKDRCTALEAQKKAQEIAFAPIVFQVSRLMMKYGIFSYLSDHREGVSLKEIAQLTKLSDYAVQVLMEASLSIGTVLYSENGYTLSKVGWFMINDRMVKANLEFNHDVNYQGLFYLDEALEQGKPAGLKTLGDWPTIYEGLSSLPEQVQKSWFGFDHFYSDESFNAALKIVFDGDRKVRRLLDVGGNTGRWAQRCVGYNPDVEVTVMDLPQQLELLKKQTAGKEGAERIATYPCNLLDESVAFPQPPFDVIWMSQFLDCFSEKEVTSICRRAAASMDADSRLLIMETFWDRQRFETAAYCLTLTSLYFTALANGNSKMYHSEDMERCVVDAGLVVEKVVDHLGLGHSIMVCRKA